MASVRVGVLTVSDRAARGDYIDESGQVLASLVQSSGHTFVNRCVVSDVELEIIEALNKLVNDKTVDVVLTTGGTGISERDVTPEATAKVITKALPNISTAIFLESLKHTPFAMISRGIAGIVNKVLIINFPGSVKAVKECFSVMQPILQHCCNLLSENKEKVDQTHSQLTPINHTCHQHIPETVKEVTILDEEKVSVDKALSFVLCVNGFHTENVPLASTLGMYLSDSVYSKVMVPSYPASIKDGFAVRFSDFQKVGSISLRWVGRVSAGPSEKLVVKSGECCSINTGGCLPNSCDTIVMIEETSVVYKGSDGKFISFETNPTHQGVDVRQPGSDLQIGDLIGSKNMLVSPQAIGMLALNNDFQQTFPCFCWPKVAVVSTGGELLANSVIDTNRPMLLASLAQMYPNYYRQSNIIDGGILPDHVPTLTEKIKELLSEVDILISTGGVSMGDADLIRDVVEALPGCTSAFSRLNMKPGKPMKFWRVAEKSCVFGLPGNPVSAFVTFHLFVAPLIKKMAGYLGPPHRTVKARLRTQSPLNLDPRPEYLRCVLEFVENGYVARPLAGSQCSSRLASTLKANALLCLPGKTTEVPTLNNGTVLDAILLSE